MNDGITAKQFHESDGVEDWRVVGDGACTFFLTGSFAAGARLVQAIGGLAGLDEHHPDVDLRHDGVTVRLITYTHDWYGMSQRDVELARRISAVARELGVPADPSAVQSILFTIDARVSAEVMPFWHAVLGYEYRVDNPTEDLIDPRGRGPSIWFQKTDEPGSQDNRIHVDVWVPHDQVQARIAAAIAAGGHLVTDKYAPAWWTLTDSEGNVADVATTVGRD
jgi:4a-hydroxytetrahydrobiopterin dehydratase